MGIIYQIPTWMQRLYPGAVFRVMPSLTDAQPHADKEVYITFDDGPVPEVTPYVLDILRTYNAHATFFQVGDNRLRYPQLAQRVLDEGHTLGNHTMHHTRGWRCTTNRYMEDVWQAQRTFSNSSAVQQPLCPGLFRPPHGRIFPAQRRALQQLGYTIVLWDVLTHDYNSKYTPERIVAIIRRYTRPGSIILFHDSVKASRNVLTALPLALQWLAAEGYTFRALPDTVISSSPRT